VHGKSEAVLALHQLATRMRLASNTDPDGETQPWTEEALLAAQSTPKHRNLFKPAWAGLALGFGAVAGWRLLPLVGEPNLADAQVRPLMQGLAAGVLCVLLLLGLVLWQWRAQRQAGHALRRTADQLRRGAWTEAADDLRQPPMSTVPSAFGELAAQVEGVMGETERRWKARAELSADWYWETDEQGRIANLTADSTLLQSAGRPLADVLGKRLDELGFVQPNDGHWSPLADRMTRQERFHNLELTVQGPTPRWVSLNGRPRWRKDGSFAGHEGLGRDITLRKMSEQMLVKHNRELQLAVASRTRELEMSNRDLDNFAQQLANELRTPIGQVQAMADLLGTRMADHLQADDAAILDLQRRAAADMRVALDALLDLARSSTEGIERQEVNLSRLAETVIAELPAIDRVAPVLWDIQPGLTAWASATQMRIVLQQLLGNAAKFTRRAERPVVSFTGAHDTEGLLTLKLSDNGVGFDDSRAERLFQPFQRLHRPEDYQGTGIGLAIVQRIVQRHGGSISASGSPGRGATFEFTLGQRAR
jgi:PAS domain S-box-containing protein